MLNDFIRGILPVVRARVNAVLRRRGLYTPARSADLCQTVLLALIDDHAAAMKRFDPTRGMSFPNFIGLLSRSNALRALEREAAKKRGGGALHTDLEHLDRHAEARADTEGEVALRRGLAGMCPCLCDGTSERDRLIGQMLHVDGLPPVDVARTLGISRGAVDKANHKLKKAFKRCLDER